MALLWPRLIGRQMWAIALAGAAVGSFLNHVATDFIEAPAEALPRLRSLTSKRSTCGACGKTIAAWENIPVASFILLKGRRPIGGWSMPSALSPGD